VLKFILDEEAALAGVINKLTESNIKIVRFDKHEPTLEDVFINLVGRSMDEVEKEGSNAAK
jgi:ABC-2 type transport system ATP-binding protein